MLKVAGFKLALYANAAILFFYLHDDGGVRPAQQLRQNYSGLRVSVVIGLQTCEDQIELFFFNGCSKCFGGVVGIESDKGVVFQMNRTVCAFS